MPESRHSSAVIRPACLISLVRNMPSLLPLDLSAPLDDAERAFLWWWRRMHRRQRGPIFASLLKRVSWSADGATPQRFVWEVAQWRQGRTLAWVFLCWSIDAPVGVWWKKFGNERTALRYCSQSPAAVMASKDLTGLTIH